MICGFSKLKNWNVIADAQHYLSKLSEKRPDIFEGEEVGLARKVREEAKTEKVVWDGHSASMNQTIRQAQQKTFEEQMAILHNPPPAPV